MRSASWIALLVVAFGCAGMPDERATSSVNSVTIIQAAALEHLFHHNYTFIAEEAELYCIRVGDRDASPELLRILHSVNAKAASGPECWGRTGKILVFTVSEQAKIDPDTARVHVYYREHAGEDEAQRPRAESSRSYTCALRRAEETWIVESCS